MSSGLKLLIALLVACLCLLLLGPIILEHNSASRLTQALIYYHWLFTLWRYGLYIFILILWPYFITLIGKRQRWSRQTVVYLSNQRLKLFTFFVIIEMLFVYNIIGQLLVWL